MVKVDSFKWGSIVVGGKKYHSDIVILPGGTVQKRMGIFGSLLAHTIKREEIERLVKTGARVIVVGTGDSGKAHLSAEAQRYSEEAEPEIIVLISPEAKEKLNQLVEQGQQPAALFHITC